MPGESIVAFNKRCAKATDDDVVVLDSAMFSEESRCKKERLRNGWWHRCLDTVGHSGKCDFSKVGKHGPDHDQEGA